MQLLVQKTVKESLRNKIVDTQQETSTETTKFYENKLVEFEKAMSLKDVEIRSL